MQSCVPFHELKSRTVVAKAARSAKLCGTAEPVPLHLAVFNRNWDRSDLHSPVPDWLLSPFNRPLR